ncbi:cold shock domain-containing protein [Candidatus Magnetaquicoccus inordinatus]|uniref:cold shock domain-containing protein n=1 Tax=Candidatus Magnetaquicoccus inordinatus TaxID=2496818 RepID=UPI00102CCE6B|nr:cold shock domain-containing protein [Candidatus Magnetaquicoccus inordinatus]
MITTPCKSFCCIRIHNTEALKSAFAEADWIALFTRFYVIVKEQVLLHEGELVRSLGDGLLGAFMQTEQALQCAIAIQESLIHKIPYASTGFSCKAAVASGPYYRFAIDDSLFDYLGTAVDIAQQLCERANGNAVLLHHPPMSADSLLPIQSQAGVQQQRTLEEYYFEQPLCKLQGIKSPVRSYAIFWQAVAHHYHTSQPMGEFRCKSEEEPEQPAVQFGKVTAFKKERGFGFIQYFSDENEYREIYFHMSYVVGQAVIQENDHVQFVIKPGKEGRPQACSVLVMGGRMIGQVADLASDGSGYITIRNQASEVIRFLILPHVSRHLPLRMNDVVEFVVGSGSESEGLIATEITLHPSDKLPHTTETGDNLSLGTIEQAIVTVYFADKGYGFAKCRRNNIYVHVSELTDPEHIPAPGELIEFEVSPGRDGTYRANNIRSVQRKE